jgi:hypothetical protein
MAFETSRQRKAIQEWSRLAIQLLGAAESGHFDHITPVVISRDSGVDVFEFLSANFQPRCGRSADRRMSVATNWRGIGKFSQKATNRSSSMYVGMDWRCSWHILHLVDIMHTEVPV